MNQNNLVKVKEYYNKNQKWYNLFYIDKKSLGIHYGFWYGKNGLNQREEALTNQYRKIAELLDIKKGDKILDAGCGIGGACFWIAENFDVEVVGITISEEQLKIANTILERKNLKSRIRFYLMDYFQTNFNDETFDKIFGIESFCYAYPNPYSLYKEIFRILRKKGRLVISDGLLLRHPKTEKEKLFLKNFVKGYALKGMNTPEEIINYLESAGFQKIRSENMTDKIAKSVKEIYFKGIIVSPLFYIFRLMRLSSKVEADNFKAVFSQKRLYDLGLFGYYIFVANKI